MQLFLIESTCAQINLVKNPSFEDTIKCPDPWGFVDPYVQNWKNPTGCTPDYYNSCAAVGTGCNVPNNLGYQYAKSGNGYCGIYGYAKAGMVREYIQGQLSDSLIAGEKYTVSFYASLTNVSQYSINRLGAYLSQNAITGSSCDNLPYSPQVLNFPFRQLKDTLGWMLIEGDFIANGGEKYITIGNFSDDTNTDTLLFNSSPWGTGKVAYYHIDEVSVMKKFNIPTLIGGDHIFEINSLPEWCMLYLYNTLGQIVYRNDNYNNDFNSINVRSGIYYYNIQLPFFFQDL